MFRNFDTFALCFVSCSLIDSVYRDRVDVVSGFSVVSGFVCVLRLESGKFTFVSFAIVDCVEGNGLYYKSLFLVWAEIFCI